eukprot:6470118-Amphidinium_carterae.1
MADLAEDFGLSRRLAEAPRDIYTRFWYQRAHPVETIPRPPVAAEDPDQPGLPVPTTPTKDEIAQHAVTHVPFKDWCSHCVAGRARGDAHRRRTEHEHACVYEADWTYWPSADSQVDVQTHAGAVCSLTVVHRSSGMIMATACENKVKNVYSEGMFV